jgi:predicted Fe-S protein YdhL (DUF1289 family)
MTDAATASKSPCTKVCVVHPAHSICIGCGRSLDEIAHWIALSETERTAIMAQLPARLAAIGGAKAATA